MLHDMAQPVRSLLPGVLAGAEMKGLVDHPACQRLTVTMRPLRPPALLGQQGAEAPEFRAVGQEQCLLPDDRRADDPAPQHLVEVNVEMPVIARTRTAAETAELRVEEASGT